VAQRIERYMLAEQRLWESVGVEPVERRIRLRSGGMVRVQVVGDGHPALFIHGASNAGTSWMGLIAALPEFRCIALDRPGCGLSDPLVGGPLRDIDAIESYADSLVSDVLDALELPTAHVLATSYGGYFAFRGAAAHPDRVDRVVEYSWPMGAPMDKVVMSMRLGGVPGVQDMLTRLPVTRVMVRTLLRQIGLRRALDTGRFNEDMVDWYVSVLRDTDTMRNEVRSSPKVVTPISGLNQRMLLSDDVVSHVTMPVLFLWGDEDPNGGPSVARAFAERFPNAELEVIPKAGHAPWIDELELCADRTRSFLRE
jgi:pimeloyl-ACP methyl ester carboxylesterase